MHVCGECQCGLDQVVRAHSALLPSDIFYVLVLFLLYFYGLLNSFFWLCFVWSSLQIKQFCSEKDFENCPDEEWAGASLVSNVPSWSWLWIHKLRFQPSHHWRYRFDLWKTGNQKGALICNSNNTGTFWNKMQNSWVNELENPFAGPNAVLISSASELLK